MSQYITKNKLNKIFSNIPELTADRIVLRKILPEDCADMYSYSHREEVTRYLLWYPHPDYDYTYRYIKQLQEQYKTGEFTDWGIILKSNGRMIGTCGFTSFDVPNNRGEIGYVLNPEYWGKGIAAEAACTVMRFGFGKLNLNRIEAKYIIGNDQSRRVMEKCGMKFEGVLRQHMLIKGDYKDIGVCSILRGEFIASDPVAQAESMRWYRRIFG